MISFIVVWFMNLNPRLIYSFTLLGSMQKHENYYLSSVNAILYIANITYVFFKCFISCYYIDTCTMGTSTGTFF